MSDERKLEIHYADEWAALYVDGKLERVGDSYLAEERAAPSGREAASAGGGAGPLPELGCATPLHTARLPLIDLMTYHGHFPW
jgi:hypothetical protein